MSGIIHNSISEDKMLAYIYDDMDDSDIFALDALNTSLTECREKDQQTTDETNHKITDIMVENEQLKVMIEKLQKDKDTLEMRISELYKTAKAEMARKDHRLQELNEEKNNLLFRRNNNNFINKNQNNAIKRDNVHDIVEIEKEVTKEEFRIFDTSTYKIPKTKHIENPNGHEISPDSKVLQDSVEEVTKQYSRSQDHNIKIHQHTSLATSSTSKENDKKDISSSNDAKATDNCDPRRQKENNITRRKSVSHDVNNDNIGVLQEIYDSEPRNYYSREKSRSRNKSQDRRRSPPNKFLARRSRSLAKERLDSARNRGRSKVRQEDTESKKDISKPRNEFKDKSRKSRSLSRERLGSARDRGRSRVRLQNKGRELYRQESKPRNEFEGRPRRPPRTPSGSPPRSPSIDHVAKRLSSIESFSTSHEKRNISQEKDSNEKTLKEQLIIHLNRNDVSNKSECEDDEDKEPKNKSPKDMEIVKQGKTTTSLCRKSRPFSASNEKKNICKSEEKLKEPIKTDSKKNSLEEAGVVNEQSIKHSKEPVIPNRFDNTDQKRKTEANFNDHNINMKDLETDINAGTSKYPDQDRKAVTAESVACENRAQPGRNRRNSAPRGTEKVHSGGQDNSTRDRSDYDSKNEKSGYSKMYLKENPRTHREENCATRNYNFRAGPRDRDKNEYNSKYIDTRYGNPVTERPRDNYNKRSLRRSRSRSRDRGRFPRNSEQDRYRQDSRGRFSRYRYNESKFADENRYRNTSVNANQRSHKYDQQVTSRDISRLKQKIIRYSLERDPKGLKQAMEKRNDEKRHRRGNDTDYSDLDDLVLRLSGASEEISSVEEGKNREDKQIYDEHDDDFELVKDLGSEVLTMSEEELENLLQWRLKELQTPNLTFKNEKLELTDIEEGQLTEEEEQEGAIGNQENMHETVEAKDTQIETSTRVNHFKTIFEARQHRKALNIAMNRQTDTIKEKKSQRQSESNTLVDNKVKRKIDLDLYKQRKRDKRESAIGNAKVSEDQTREPAQEKELPAILETNPNGDLTKNNKNDESNKSYSLELRIQSRKNIVSGEFIMENIDVDVGSSTEETDNELPDNHSEKSQDFSSNKADKTLNFPSVTVEESTKASTSEVQNEIKNASYALQKDFKDVDNASKDKSSFIHDFSMSDDDEAFPNNNKHPIEEDKKESKIIILSNNVVKPSIQTPALCNQDFLIVSTPRDTANVTCNSQASCETSECIEQIQEAVHDNNAKVESAVHSSTFSQKAISKINTDELQKCLEDDVTVLKQDSQSENSIANVENKQNKSFKSEINREQNVSEKATSKKLSYEDQIELLFGSVTPSPCKPSLMASRKPPLMPEVAKVKRNIMATSGRESTNLNRAKNNTKKKRFRSKSVDGALLRNKSDIDEREHEIQSKSFSTRDAKLDNFPVYYPTFSNNPNYIPNPYSEMVFHSSNSYIRKKIDEYKEVKGTEVKTTNIKLNDKTSKKVKGEKTKKSVIKVKMFDNHGKKRTPLDNSDEPKCAKKKKSHNSIGFSDLNTHYEGESKIIQNQQKHEGKRLAKKSIKSPNRNNIKGQNSAKVISKNVEQQLSNPEMEHVNDLGERDSKKCVVDKVKKKKSTNSKNDVTPESNKKQQKVDNDDKHVKESETVLRRGMRVRKQVTFYQCSLENNSNKDPANESIDKKKSPRRITPLKVGEVSLSKEEFIQNEGQSTIFSNKRKLNDSNDDDGKPNKLLKISGSAETCTQSPLPHMEEILNNDDNKPNKLRKLSNSAETFEACNQSPLPHMEEMLKNLERKSSDVNDISSLDNFKLSEEKVPSVIEESKNIPATVDVNHLSFTESIHQINLDTKDVVMLGAFERGIFENMSDYLLDKSLPSLESVDKTKGSVCESAHKRCPSQLDFSNFLNKNSSTSTPIKQAETAVMKSATSQITVESISVQPGPPTFTSNLSNNNKTSLGSSNITSSSKSYFVSPLKRDRRKRVGIVMIDIA